MKMLLRLARTSVAAVRHFSAEATAVEAATKPTAAGGGTGSPATTSKGGWDTLGRRLLSLVYAKRSAVITIRKWKEEGHAVRKYELNRVVRELRKLRRYKHAVEVCEWMRIQDDIHLLSGDYAVHLDLIAKVRGINSAEKFFEDIPDKMKDHATCSALLHCYVQQQDCVKAEALMEKMFECGFVKHPLPYNHMLSLYISTGQLEKIPAMIQELKKNTSPDLVSYNLWLAVCASLNDVETAEKIFLELKKVKIDPDWVTYSTLTSIYIRSSQNEKASSTLRDMEKRVFKRTRVAFPSLISLYTSLKNKSEVHRVWKKMKSIFHKLNDSEYSCMISSLLKLDEFEEALKTYTEWESVSVTKDTRISNLILAAYVNKNELGMAEDFREKMAQKGIPISYTTWEVLTSGYMKHKKMNEALDSFKNAVDSVKKWDPNVKMVREMFSLLEEQGNVELAEDLLVTLRCAGHVNTEIYNLLLRTYMKAGKMPLIVAERMKKDNVRMDTETQELIKLTSKMCVAEVPNHLS
nr:pentatricopeptide repeat-containing protein At4g02820, mitochondrial [Ipomoea batatas]